MELLCKYCSQLSQNSVHAHLRVRMVLCSANSQYLASIIKEVALHNVPLLAFAFFTPGRFSYHSHPFQWFGQFSQGNSASIFHLAVCFCVARYLYYLAHLSLPVPRTLIVPLVSPVSFRQLYSFDSAIFRGLVLYFSLYIFLQVQYAVPAS